METIVSIDGVVGDEASARVPVSDRGFLYGDSVFETLRTSGGRPVDGARHLERLVRSSARLSFPAIDPALVERELEATLAAATSAGHPESYVRVMVTRGSAPIGLDPALATTPRRVILVQPLRLPPAEVYERGVRAIVAVVERVSARALDPSVKSGNYLNSIVAVAEARARGADEAILCNAAGQVAETSASNLFVVHGGRVRTPDEAAGILAGITRRRVMELEPVEAGVVTASELRGADEVFVTSSIRGVVPVTGLDGRPVGDGSVGGVTRRVRAAYDAFLAEVAAGAI